MSTEEFAMLDRVAPISNDLRRHGLSSEFTDSLVKEMTRFSLEAENFYKNVAARAEEQKVIAIQKLEQAEDLLAKQALAVEQMETELTSVKLEMAESSKSYETTLISLRKQLNDQIETLLTANDQLSNKETAPRLVERDVNAAEKAQQQIIAEEQKKAEQQKLEEQQKQVEQQKLAEQQKQIEQQKLAEQQKQAEQQKLAEQQKQVEQQKLSEQRKKIEQQKLVEQQKQAEQQKLMDEQTRIQQHQQPAAHHPVSIEFDQISVMKRRRRVHGFR